MCTITGSLALPAPSGEKVARSGPASPARNHVGDYMVSRPAPLVERRERGVRELSDLWREGDEHALPPSTRGRI
ncbi:MAG TPA: hypothetical protein DCK98_14330 [Chloroflexi bacterium]|nr:hypothetical protein [Chloroflexota bacterium]HAL28755.1 hypothetical protein [Chloroflexota bacterium]